MDMDEMLTMEEIEERYDGEWVIIDEPELDDQLRVIRGTLVFHSKDKTEADRRSIELGLKRSAFLYVGKLPANVVFML
jgi:hypothetical protein